jgi:hypothetical protein
MNHLLKKRFILVLALFVSLLPFRFSYGLTVTVPDLQQKMHQHIMGVDCAQPVDNAHCLDIVAAISVTARSGRNPAWPSNMAC